VASTKALEVAAFKLVDSPSATEDAPSAMPARKLAKLAQLSPPTPQLDKAKKRRIIPVMSDSFGGLFPEGSALFGMLLPFLRAAWKSRQQT